MSPFLRIVAGTALFAALTSCLATDHFHGDPARYDGLFFGPSQQAATRATLKDQKWRNYALFGLIPWDQDQIQWAGNRLGDTGAASRPMTMVVKTEMTFVNGLASFGLSLIGGILAPALFVPRTTAVMGWERD